MTINFIEFPVSKSIDYKAQRLAYCLDFKKILRNHSMKQFCAARIGTRKNHPSPPEDQ